MADNLEDTALGSGHNSEPVPPLLHDYQPLLTKVKFDCHSCVEAV